MTSNTQFWNMVDSIRANIKSSDLDDAQSIAAMSSAVSAITGSGATTEEVGFAVTLVFLDMAKRYTSDPKNKDLIAGLEVVTLMGQAYERATIIEKQFKYTGTAGNDYLFGFAESVTGIAEIIFSKSTKYKVAFVVSKLANIAFSYLSLVSDDINTKIEEYFSEYDGLHEELVDGVNTKTDAYLNQYQSRMQQLVTITGLSVDELTYQFGEAGIDFSASFEQQIINARNFDIELSENTIARAREGRANFIRVMNGEYVEATGLNAPLTLDDVEARVAFKLGEGSDVGSFDNIATSWLNEALTFSYTTALDKIQADILSDTHDDTLNSINAQLAGIINGYSHIDEADKAAILAGWQQKFAGEFALERNGSDALLLDEIARLKTEMARLGAGENTSILDMPNPMETLAALIEQQQAALTAAMQDYANGFLGEFTDYVAGVDERQQQRDALVSLAEAPVGLVDLATLGRGDEYRYFEWRTEFGIDPAQGLYYYGNDYEVNAIREDYFGPIGIDGSDANDVLISTNIAAFYPFFDGLGGNDYLEILGGDKGYAYGGKGDDTITINSRYSMSTGEAGDDIIYSQGEGGFFFLDFIEGDNTVLDGNDAFYGNDAIDFVDAGGGDDFINAGNGNNNILGGGGSDHILTGSGDDRILSDGVSDFKISESARTDIEHVVSFEFTALRDVSEKYNDFVDAGNGNNRIIAGAGDDYVLTGEGDDVIAGDFSKYVSFADVDQSVIVPFSYHGNDYISSGGGNDYVYGGAGSDYIDGGSGNNIIYGDDPYESSLDYLNDFESAGNDTLISAEGNDYIYGGAGNDNIFAGDGDNTVIAGAGHDNVETGNGNDFVFGDLSRKVKLNGVAGDTLLPVEYHGDDNISTGAGDDIVYAGGGNDFVDGGDGNDTLYGDDPHNSELVGHDTIYGGDGDDYLSGGAGDDALTGGNDNDTIYGGQGDDVLTGGSGVDFISGGAGNDRLSGDTGNDHLYGGSGNDTYLVTNGDGIDVIYDTEGQNDLQINGASLSSVKLNIVGDSLYLYYGASDVLVMDLTTVTTLSAIKFGDGKSLTQADLLQLMIESEAGDSLQTADNLKNLTDPLQGHTALNFFNGQLISLENTDLTLDTDNPASWIDAGARPVRGTLRYFRDAGGNVLSPVIDEWGRQHVPDGAITEYLRRADGSEQSFAASYISPQNLPSATTPLQGMVGDTTGYSANNQILSGSQISGGDGSDVLFAATENSQLTGDNGDDTLFGADGDDSLNGGFGDDILVGGAGDDQLRGGVGNDLYCYDLGDGADTVLNNSRENDIDILQFGAGIKPADVSAKRLGNDLVLDIKADGGQIKIVGYFDYDATSSSALDVIHFSEGDISWNIDYIKTAVLNGSEEDEVLNGYEGSDDFINAGAGNDILFGKTGDDLLVGGEGNDQLYGGSGNDLYVFDRGDGKDTVYNHDGDDEINADSVDRLRFGTTITLEDVQYSRLGNDLVLKIKDTMDSITVNGWFNKTGSSKLQAVEFADGRTLDLAQVELAVQTIKGDNTDNILRGFETNDVIDGAAGNDQLYGGAGDDTYLFGRGDGQDVIFNHDSADYANPQSVDRLLFKEGIEPADIEYYRSGNSLVFRIVGSNDTILINKWFSEDGSHKLQSVNFYDGRSLDLALVEKEARAIHGDDNDNDLNGYDTGDEIFGHAGNDVLRGYGGDDQLLGGAGNDSLYAMNGDDKLDGGAGNDLMVGGTGNDTYLFGLGDGQDIIKNYDLTDSANSSSHDRLIFKQNVALEDVKYYRSGDDLVFQISSGNDKLTVANWFRNAPSDRLQSVEFADGHRLDLAQIELDVRNIHGDAENNILIGADTDDVLYGYEGNDQLEGGGGSDAYHFARGWGQDVIHNYDSGTNKTDKIIFASGIAQSEIQVERVEDDLILSLANSTDSIKVSRYFNGDGASAYSLEQICFADGTVWQLEDIKASLNIADNTDQRLYGYSTADEIMAGGGDDRIWGRTGDDILYGDEGNDVLFGEGGADILHGGTGADSLYGGSGNDTLNGGDGNDYLFGSDGNDQYIFSAGHGNDVIRDSSGVNRIKFVDINPNDITIRRGVTINSNSSYANNDAIITNIHTGDVIKIELQLDANSGIAEIVFADGTVWDRATMLDNMTRATAGNDVMAALRTGSVIHAGEGNDTLYGDRGDDELHGDAGDDLIQDLNGNNLLFGGAGNDQIIGRGVLNGGSGQDVLEGKGADELIGGEGDDTLIAYSNSYTQNTNSLEGGKGNDTIYGGFGDDTYVFNLGDGADVIIERRQGEAYSNVAASNDTLQFGAGIVADDLTFIRSGSDLLIRHSNGSDSITVQNWFAGSAHYKLNTLTFTDGSVLSAEQVESQLVTLGTGENDSLFGSADKNDVIYGDAGDDYIDGRGGNNTLYGDAGSDTLVGGAGNDLLVGGTGDDKYVFNPQSGQDTIDNAGGGVDGIFFTNGIDSSRLSFSQDGDDLVILVDNDDTQSVRVLNHFLGGDAAISYVQPSGGYMITAEQIAAAIAGDGDEEEPTDPTPPTDPVDPVDPDPVEPVDPGQGDGITPGLGGNDELTGTAGNDVLLAGAGDDVLTSMAGNDKLFGGTGSDSYVYHAGQDVITEQSGTDKLIFSNGITFNAVASGLTKSGNDLILKVNGSTANSVTLTNFFLGGDHLVESFEFETGGSISAAQIFGAFGLAMPTGEAPAVNAVHGTAGNDTLSGSADADVLSGSHGNDSLNGGAGNDTLIGGRGNDTYVFAAGSGHDIIDNTGGGEDVLLFEGISFNQVASGLMKSGNDLVLNIGGSSDKVTIKNWFLGGDFVVPTLRFASGGQISADQIFGAFGLANPNPQSSLAYSDLPDERAFGNVFVGTGAAETIIASSDDDFIDGGDGSDTLSGGVGNDYLLGGRGNDTFLFQRGDGQDVINNYDPTVSKNDRLLFGEGISKANVQYHRSGDNLVVQISNSTDSVTLQNWFSGSDYQLTAISFADGQLVTAADINAAVSAEPASFSAQASSTQTAQFAMQPMAMSSSAQSFDNDNGIVRSDLKDELLQHQRVEPAQNAKSFWAKHLGAMGISAQSSSHKAGFANNNDLPQSELASELKAMVADGKVQREIQQPFTTDMLLKRLSSSVSDFTRPAEFKNGNDLPQSDLAAELREMVGVNAPAAQRFNLAKNLLINEVETKHASLVDALNAFDSDDAEIGGNLAIPPKFEEYYY